MSFGAIKKRKTLKIIYLVTTHIFFDIENLGFYYFSDFLHIIFFLCVWKKRNLLLIFVLYFCCAACYLRDKLRSIMALHVT